MQSYERRKKCTNLKSRQLNNSFSAYEMKTANIFVMKRSHSLSGGFRVNVLNYYCLCFPMHPHCLQTSNRIKFNIMVLTIRTMIFHIIDKFGMEIDYFVVVLF